MSVKLKNRISCRTADSTLHGAESDAIQVNAMHTIQRRSIAVYVYVRFSNIRIRMRNWNGALYVNAIANARNLDKLNIVRSEMFYSVRSLELLLLLFFGLRILHVRLSWFWAFSYQILAVAAFYLFSISHSDLYAMPREWTEKIKQKSLFCKPSESYSIHFDIIVAPCRTFSAERK